MLRSNTLVTFGTAQDLLDRLGGIPARRVLLDPRPGTATIRDVIRYVDGDDKRLVELVDGTLVQKAMGAREAFLGSLISHWMQVYLESTADTGMVLGADGTLRIMPGLVRIPDVSYTAWEKLPKRRVPNEPVPHLVPDLAVEVISKGNTAGEMKRKLGEYLAAGIAEVWMVFPKSRSIRVYHPATGSMKLEIGDTLRSRVLAGFEMPLAKLFEKLEAEPPAKKRKS